MYVLVDVLLCAGPTAPPASPSFGGESTSAVETPPVTGGINFSLFGGDDSMASADEGCGFSFSFGGDGGKDTSSAGGGGFFSMFGGGDDGASSQDESSGSAFKLF